MVFFRIKHNKNKKKEDRYYAYICRTFRNKEKTKIIHEEEIKLGRVYPPFTAVSLINLAPDYEREIRKYLENRSGERQLKAAEKSLNNAKKYLEEGKKGMLDKSM